MTHYADIDTRNKYNYQQFINIFIYLQNMPIYIIFYRIDFLQEHTNFLPRLIGRIRFIRIYTKLTCTYCITDKF